MIILQSGPSHVGIDYIQRASSDCGRVHYYPHGSRILIDGRDAHRRSFINLTTGFTTRETVDDGTWNLCCDLMAEVDAHNAKVSHMAQAADFTRQDARDRAEVDALSRLGGYYECGVTRPGTT